MVFKKIVNMIHRENRVLFSEQNYFLYIDPIYIYIHLGWYLNQNLYNSGVAIRIIIRSAGVGIGVGIVHKKSVGVGIGVRIVTKVTGVGVGIGIEKVCWNRNRNH